MALDLNELTELTQRHGLVARICVAEIAGSAPREVGAAVLVWADGQSGTIGGGALEFEAVKAARKSLKRQTVWGRYIEKVPLGPAIGQCCGGTVTLLREIFSAADIGEIIAQAGKHQMYARPVQSRLDPFTAPQPLAVARRLKAARASGGHGIAQLGEGWFVEPLQFPCSELWIYGAGHVGRALVAVMAPLNLHITWVDTDGARFPEDLPSSVTRLIAKNPADVVKYAPSHAHHLVLTYSHALDLELCHQLLSQRFASLGLIGSKTKWARFQKRLAGLGHSAANIASINCPIGSPSFGKSPQAIAIGVASDLLRDRLARAVVAEPKKDIAL